MPKSERGKYDALQWLMFQMGSVGPMFGQAHHFMRAKKDEVPYGSERYGNEAKRLYGVMDRQLEANEYLSGRDTPSPTFATYPWVARHEWHRVDLGQFPRVKRWYDAIGGAPAVVTRDGGPQT
jgi:GST-like protein